MKNDKMLSIIGLATKAGKVSHGGFSAENSVKRGKSHLLIVARDASDNTKKSFANMCKYHETDYIEYGDKETLAACCGKQYTSVVSINDANFKKLIINIYEQCKNGGSASE